MKTDDKPNNQTIQVKENKPQAKAFVTKVISIFCVILLILLFITNLGDMKVFKVQKPTEVSPSVPVPSLNYDLNEEVLNAMSNAFIVANDYVEAELDVWINEMMSRVDENFLDDYFSFMQVKKREILTVYNSIKKLINKNAETAEEAAIRELEEEISRKIIIPEIAQARINNITDEAIKLYVNSLDEQLADVQKGYNVPTLDWNKYISSICGLTFDMENKNYPIAFKSVVTSGAALTGYAMAPVIKNVATKVSTKVAEKSAAKIAEKAAITAVAKTTGKQAGNIAKSIPYVGWGVTAAICAWEIVDYSNTATEGKELLRENLFDYFQEVKKELLASKEQSIMGSIILWENDVKANIANN
jgi:hypothetical protein